MRKKTALVVLASVVVFSALAILFVRWRETTDPEYRLQKGQEAARAGNFTEAIRYAQLLEDDSQTDRAHLLRGEILFRQKDYSEALRTLNRIGDQGSIRLQAVVLSGTCLFNLGEFRHAEGAFLFVLSQDPRHIDAHRHLGAIDFDQGDLPAAVDHLREVASLDPKDPLPHRLIGLIHKDLDQIDEAVGAFEEALRRNPSDELATELRTEWAECLLKKRDYERALSLTDGIDNPTAAATRAEALINLDRPEEALPLLDQGLQRYPNHVGLLRLRGELFLSARRPQDAVALLQRAVKNDPSDFRARHQLALAFEQTGKTQEAKREHQKVKDVQKLLTDMTNLGKEAMGRPWDADIRLRLADLADQLEKPQMAAMWRHAAAACAAK